MTNKKTINLYKKRKQKWLFYNCKWRIIFWHWQPNTEKIFVNWKTWDSTEYTILKKSNVLLDLLKKKWKEPETYTCLFFCCFFIRRRTPSNRKWVSNTLLSGNDSWNMKHGREGMTQRTGGTAQSRPGTRRLLTVPFWNPLGRLGFHNYTVIPYCGISELSTASNASAWRKAEASRTVLHFNELYIYTTEYTYFAFCTLRHILSLSCFSPIEQWLHKSRSAYGAACLFRLSYDGAPCQSFPGQVSAMITSAWLDAGDFTLPFLEIATLFLPLS